MNVRIVFGLIGAALAFGNANAGEVNDVWRRAENGGINVLYCFLQLNGRPVDYSVLEAEQKLLTGGGNHSARTLCELSALHGIALSTRAVTIADLKSIDRPAIVHVDGETLEAGTFLLLLRITGNKVYYIEGSTGSLTSRSREDFQRLWSGVVLVPTPPKSRQITCAILGAVVGVCLVGLRRLPRRITDRSN